MRWISAFIVSLLLLVAGAFSYNSVPRGKDALHHVLALAEKHSIISGQKATNGNWFNFRNRYTTRHKYKMTISSDDDDDEDQVETKKAAQALSFHAPVVYISFSVYDVHGKTIARQSEQPEYCLTTPIYLRYRSIRV